MQTNEHKNIILLNYGCLEGGVDCIMTGKVWGSGGELEIGREELGIITVIGLAGMFDVDIIGLEK